MRLAELIDDAVQCERPWQDLEISSIQEDSRKVCPGDLFFAIQGLTVDGHAFAPRAEAQGLRQ